MQYNNSMKNMRMPVQPVCKKPMVKESGCDYNTEYMDQFPLGMAYVPWQEWNETYSVDCALNHGTIFPELNLPFNCASPACRGMKGGRV